MTLILGLYFANFLESVTRTSCANAGLEQSGAIGRAAYIGTTIFVVAGIFEILDIASEIVIWAFILVFGAALFGARFGLRLGRPRRRRTLPGKMVRAEEKRVVSVP